MFLNLGSGKRKIKDSLDIDINKASKPDVVHDLNITPYPFEKNTFEGVYCYDVLEHLDDLMSVMAELHRICKNRSLITIESPHFSSVNAYTDPTHKHYFGLFSFDYFTGENMWSYYTENRFRFKNIKRKIIFQKGIFKKCFEWFFNHYPHFYETKIAWVIPAEKIHVVLKVIKKD